MEIRPGAAPRALTAAELRDLDRRCTAEFGLPSLVLMEHAGAGAARELLAWLERRGRPPGERVAVLCGPGNNGGDGAVVARCLDAAGRDVRVFLLVAPDRLAGDARAEHEILRRSRIDLRAEPGLDALARALAECGVLVDALLGTGTTGRVREPCASWIRLVRARRAEGAAVVALDLPSGFDADAGGAGADVVEADLTLSFAAPKRAFAAPEAARFTGEVVVLPIGAPRAAWGERGG